MSRQPKIFDLALETPCKQTKLNQFKKQHGILTYHSDHMTREEEPWIAILPFDKDMGKTINQILEAWNRYDDSNRTATATGELTSVRKLCQQMNLACDI